MARPKTASWPLSGGFEIELERHPRGERRRHQLQLRLRRWTVAALLAGGVPVAALAFGDLTGDLAGKGQTTHVVGAAPQVETLRAVRFGVAATEMADTLASLLPDGQRTTLRSTAHADGWHADAAVPRASQSGTVMYDDGTGPGLVKVTVRRSDDNPCAATGAGCETRPDGTLVMTREKGDATAVTAFGRDGFSVTVTQYAGATPRGPATRSTLPLSPSEILDVATSDLWVR